MLGCFGVQRLLSLRLIFSPFLSLTKNVWHSTKHVWSLEQLSGRILSGHENWMYRCTGALTSQFQTALVLAFSVWLAQMADIAKQHCFASVNFEDDLMHEVYGWLTIQHLSPIMDVDVPWHLLAASQSC